jgi:cell division protein FtsL
MKRTKKSKKNKNFRLTRFLLVALCVLSGAFYFLSKTVVSSMNLQLSVQESTLENQIAKKKQAVEDLQNEVDSLQEKSRVMTMLDNSVSDNENNIYVIND